MAFAATPPFDGTLATYYNLNASFAHKVPDTLTLEEASLMEPLSVAVYATAYQGKVAPLQNVLVFGAGPIGLLSAAVARAFGAKRV
jgi:D-xylulose reductase